jgi:hypothetical protein
MAYAGAAPELERLPWLKEERKPARRNERPWLLAWGMVAVVLVGGVSYWAGINSPQGGIEQQEPAPVPSATVRLPEPAAREPAPEVALPRMPEVTPVPAQRDVRVAPRREVRRARRLDAPVSDSALPAVVAAQQGEGAASQEAAETKAEPKPVTYWPASESEGAAGRVVRIGTYPTRYQAKRAWWRVVRTYPGMRTLKAVVAPVPSLRTGRTYYRLQFGTTSQAHSAILCQRMRVVGVSCTVVGVP